MKKTFLITVIFTALLFSCNNEGSKMSINPPQIGLSQDTLHVIREFKGLYRYDGKNRTFISCDDPQRIHLVENKTYQVDTLYKSVLSDARNGEEMYLEMNAEINPSPDPAFADLLIVKEFLKAEQKNQINNCIPEK